MLWVALLGCTGSIGEPPELDPDTPLGPDGRREALPSDQSPSSAIPRLSRREIDHVVEDVFGYAGLAIETLPPDARTATNPDSGGEEEVFDTFSGTLETYLPGEVFVQGQATLAFEVARRVVEDSALLDRLTECDPTVDESPCLENLVDRVGLQLFRRPLSDEERTRLLAAASSFADTSYEVRVRAVLQALLASPDWVYRVGVGQPDDDLRELNNFEVLSRLAFHLWGRPPDEPFLQRAFGDRWSDDEYEQVVRDMAADPRMGDQVRALHADWLRHETLIVSDEELAADMMTETDALLDRALGDGAWSDLFTATETFVSPALAEHYGMDPIDEPQWVPTANPERSGMLTHGSFLSLSSTQGDGTLPSRRGAILAERILCSPIPPPPSDVDIDDGVEVEMGECKSDAYLAHRVAGSSCEGCHSHMDPLGFGFERFNGLGVYRTEERLNPACSIEGSGSVGGQDFIGPREFAEQIARSGDLTACGTTQMMRYALRRPLAADDAHTHVRLHDAFVSEGEDFQALMVALALDPTFRYRKEAP